MPAIKTAKSKTRSRRKTKPKSKAERKEINQRNAMGSTGPRTARGKENSKYNAFKHGMTARTVLLPGEGAAALAARQRHLIEEDRHPLFAKESAGHGVTNGVIEVTQFTRCPLSVPALAGCG